MSKNKKSPVIEIIPQKKQGTSLTRTDVLSQYIAEVNRYPLLTREEEQRIAILYYKTKDKKYAHMLVTANLRFVIKVATEYTRFGKKLLELIQEGNIGLLSAVQEFNPYKEVRLITYAVWWIRGCILEYLLKQSSIVKMGTNKKQKKIFYALRKEIKNLNEFQKQIPQFAKKLNIKPEDVLAVGQRVINADVSLDDASQNIEKIYKSQNENLETPENIFEKKETLNRLKENIKQIKKNLSKKEQFILEKRILAEDKLTLLQIGSLYNTTKEAVRQMEGRIIKKIKNQFIK